MKNIFSHFFRMNSLLIFSFLVLGNFLFFYKGNEAQGRRGQGGQDGQDGPQPFKMRKS